MIVYDKAKKVLDRNISSAQHHWPDFWHYIYCFIQSAEAFTVKGNKHTHITALRVETPGELLA